MDLYISSMLLGVAGLGVMAVSGLGTRGHGGPSGGHAAGGHSAGHGVAHSAHGANSAARGSTHSSHSVGGKALWLITSPRFLFSFFLGLGTAGLLLRPFIGGPVQLAAAVAGGVLFERILVSPLWNLAMRFASTPSSNLESAVSDEATAVTSFDENGHGIVSVEVDGQIMQILATLRPNDRLLGGARIRAGQRVRVEEVDSDKNQCTVSLI